MGIAPITVRVAQVLATLLERSCQRARDSTHFLQIGRRLSVVRIRMIHLKRDSSGNNNAVAARQTPNIFASFRCKTPTKLGNSDQHVRKRQLHVATETYMLKLGTLLDLRHDAVVGARDAARARWRAFGRRSDVLQLRSRLDCLQKVRTVRGHRRSTGRPTALRTGWLISS